jgi:glycosyltransferase involved in cell wall biosynthesis
MQPLVSVICLCHNYHRYVTEALESVLAQTYPHLELIVVDDASTDGSREILEHFCKRVPSLQFFPLEKNVGTCAAFNHGWRRAKGEFIVDFAADDVMLPTRIEEQVKSFRQLGPEYGVVYTDAELIDEDSRLIGHHYNSNWRNRKITFHPSGDVFTAVLKHYFICQSTLMSRREVFEQLGGYDEELAYEDFDFWVRSSRSFYFYFLDRALTKRRMHAASQSKKWYAPGDRQLQSTVRICWKSKALCHTKEEKEALVVRVKSEIRQAFFTENFAETKDLFHLLGNLTKPDFPYMLIEKLNRWQVRLSLVRKIYHWLRYGQ